MLQMIPAPAPIAFHPAPWVLPSYQNRNVWWLSDVTHAIILLPFSSSEVQRSLQGFSDSSTFLQETILIISHFISSFGSWVIGINTINVFLLIYSYWITCVIHLGLVMRRVAITGLHMYWFHNTEVISSAEKLSKSSTQGVFVWVQPDVSGLIGVFFHMFLPVHFRFKARSRHFSNRNDADFLIVVAGQNLIALCSCVWKTILISQHCSSFYVFSSLSTISCYLLPAVYSFPLAFKKLRLGKLLSDYLHLPFLHLLLAPISPFSSRTELPDENISWSVQWGSI